MNKKNTRRTLAVSALSMLLCLVMLAGSTFAWFTDTVEVTKNRIVAGVLDVEMYYQNPFTGDTWNDIDPLRDDEPAPFFVNSDGEQIVWEPGVVAYANFKIANAGDRALEYDLSTFATAFNTVKDTDKSLKDVIKVGVISHGGTEPELISTRAAAIEAIAEGTWASFESVAKTGVLYAAGDAKMPAGGQSEEYVTVVLYWEPGAQDNAYNLKDETVSSDDDGTNPAEPLYLEADISLIATQWTHEKDSYGDQYDVLAEVVKPIVYDAENNSETESTVANVAIASSGDAAITVTGENTALQKLIVDGVTVYADNAVAVTENDLEIWVSDSYVEADNGVVLEDTLSNATVVIWNTDFVLPEGGKICAAKGYGGLVVYLDEGTVTVNGTTITEDNYEDYFENVLVFVMEVN